MSSIMTSFDTKLVPINLKIGKFKVSNETEVFMDTPIEDNMGTKKLFKEGAIVEGNLWTELARDGSGKRKIVMVEQGDDGRWLLPASDLKPTNDLEIDSKEQQKEIEKLNGKLDDIVKEAEKEAEKVIKSVDKPKGFLEQEFMGFKGKQILVASLGVIILIKVFK
jgi:hypothetical protein